MTLATKNAKDLGAIPWSHWFFYGDSGAGKTTIASSFPRPLFLVPQNESSITTLRGLDFPYFEINSMTDPLKAGVGGMSRVLDEIEREYNANPEKFAFDTIVVESVTHYADLAVEEISAGGTIAMDQFRWGRLSSHLRNIQTRLKRMQVHVVFTSLAQSEKTDAEVLIGMPLVQGKMALKLPSACDVLAFCEVKPSKNAPTYNVHTRQHKHFLARTRFRRLPAKIVNFKFPEIESYLEPGEAVAEEQTTETEND